MPEKAPPPNAKTDRYKNKEDNVKKYNSTKIISRKPNNTPRQAHV